MTSTTSNDNAAQPSGLSVIIPVYNERQTIKQVLTDVRAAFESSSEPLEIIVVNDGSSDRLALDDIKPLCDRLISHRINQGYGASIMTGLRAATHAVCAIIDADGTYPASKLPELLAILRDRKAALVIGARTGDVVQAPLVRQPAKFVLKKLADYLAGQVIPDLNSGLRVFDRELTMKFESLYPRGFSLSSTQTLAFLCNNLPVEFVPVNYYKRKGSASKIRPLRDTQAILMTILRTVMYFDPLKVLFPISMLLGGGAVAVLIAGLIAGEILDSTIAVLALTSLQLLAIGLLADLIVRRSGK